MEAHILQTLSPEPGLGLGRWNDEKQIFISWIWGPLVFTHFPYDQTAKGFSFFFELRKCQKHFTVAFCQLLDEAKMPFIFVLNLVKESSSEKMRGACGERWRRGNVQDWESLMHRGEAVVGNRECRGTGCDAPHCSSSSAGPDLQHGPA